MRIGFVTQWFPPEPATVALAIAEGLAARGHDVQVLTGFPNYPNGVLHDGYPLRPYRRDIVGDVTVHRAPLYPSHDRSALRRMINYASFGVSASSVGWVKVPRPDAWLVYSSPATAALPALLSRWGRSIPMHLMIQDLWPDSVTQSTFVDGSVRRGIDAVLRRYCSWTYARATGIGVISPGMRAVLTSRGIPDAKIHDTPNWVSDSFVNTSELSPSRAALGLPHGRLFMYAGNVGELQGLDPLVSSFARVPEANLVVVGDGVARPRLQELVERERITNVHFLGARPSNEIGSFIRASDVQIVSLQDTPLLRATMPSKTQSSLAFGKPILAHAAGDVATLIGSNGVGAVAPPGDAPRSVEAIRYLVDATGAELDAMGKASRELFTQRYSSEAGLDALESMLNPSQARERIL